MSPPARVPSAPSLAGLRRTGRLAAALLLTTLLVPVAATAQSFAAPRLADGVTPDLRGVWQAHDAAYLDIQGHAAMKGAPAAHSLVIDTPDHKIPYRTEALAERDRLARIRPSADPSAKCFEAGVPRANYLPHPFQIVQSKGVAGLTAIVYQDNHAFRIVYPAAKPHQTGIDWWMGDSRGRVDGDALVVDSTSFNDLTWLDAAANHHSSSLHVVERFVRTGPDTLRYEARIDDPKTFTRPWTMRETLYRDSQPGARIVEDECLDDRDNVRHHVSPTDPKNLQRNVYTRWAIAQKLGLLSDGVDVSTPPGQTPGESSGIGPTSPRPTGTILRTAGGRPDLNGIWRTIPESATAPPPPPTPGKPPAPRVFTMHKPGDDASRDFAFAGVPRLPYTLAGLQEQMWRSRHQFLDGEPRCHIAGVPRAPAQPPYPHQIIQDDRSLAVLYEYVHETRIFPTDGSAHPSGYSAWDGDSRAHWEGDTLVVDTRNFNGRSWLSMTGNFVDENEHAVERFTMLDPDTIDYQVTVSDPGVFKRPFTLKLTMHRQPAEEQILEYACLEGEADRQHYTEQLGGQRLSISPADVGAQAAAAKAAAPAAIENGCLRAELVAGEPIYRLQTSAKAAQPVIADLATRKGMVELIDREVRLSGQADKKGFKVAAVEVVSEGCNATYK